MKVGFLFFKRYKEILFRKYTPHLAVKAKCKFTSTTYIH